MERFIDFFECKCFNNDHTLKIVLHCEGEEKPDLYLSVCLSHTSILTRIWRAIKYVLGFRCKDGHWDTFSFQPDDIDRLMRMTVEYKSWEKESHA